MKFNREQIPAFIKVVKKMCEDGNEGAKELLSFIENSTHDEVGDFLDTLDLYCICGRVSATRKADIEAEERHRMRVRRTLREQQPEEEKPTRPPSKKSGDLKRR